MNPTLKPESLLTETECAELLGVSKGTLSVWRCTKRIPLPYVKVGRLVRYRLVDIQSFINSQMKT